MKDFKFQSDSINTETGRLTIAEVNDFKFQSDSINTSLHQTKILYGNYPLNSNLILLILGYWNILIFN